MPLRLRAPYIPRYPIRRAGTIGAPSTARTAAPRGRGAVGAGGIDTSSTGNVGGDIVKAIGNQIQLNRQNAIANQIMNTQNAPRAGLFAPGVSPTTGQPNVIGANVPTTGTSPLTGGVGELQMRQQVQQQGLADQLQRAKIGAQLALANQRAIAARGVGGGGGGSAARWKQYLSGQGQGGAPGAAAKGGKPAPYVAGSGDVQNDPGTDDYSKIRTDFDAQPGQGNGSFDIFARNLGNLRDDGKGNLVVMKTVPDPSDPTKTIQVPATDKNGLPLFSIPKNDAQFYTNRVNATRIRTGQPYVGNLPDGINPNSGQPSGTQINPIQIKAGDNLTLRSLPYGTWMRLPDGSIRPKQPLGQGQQQPPAPAQPQPQAGIDTGAQQNLAANAPAPAPSDSDVNIPPGVADQVLQNASNAPTPSVQPAIAGGPGAMPPIASIPGQGPSLPQQQLAAVSPMAAGQSYLNALGLGAGAGQLYPAADLYG